MPNVKVQVSNDVQRPNKKKNEEEWNDGTLEYRVEQNNPWILLPYPFKSWSFWPERASQAPPCRRGQGAQYNETSFPGSPALWAGSFTFI